MRVVLLVYWTDVLQVVKKVASMDGHWVVLWDVQMVLRWVDMLAVKTAKHLVHLLVGLMA